MSKVGYQMEARTKWWHLKHRAILIFVILSLNKFFVIWWVQNTLIVVALRYTVKIWWYNHTSVYIIAIVFKCTFLSLLLNEVWRLCCYLFSSYSIFIKGIMIIVIIKRNSLANINTFLATRILKKLLCSDSNLEYRVYLSRFQEFI